MKRRAYLAEIGEQPASKRPKATSLNRTVQMAVAREVSRNQDTKYTDSNAALANVTTTGTIISATVNLARGTSGFNNFYGNQIAPKGFTLSYAFTTTQAYSFMRVMVFQWFDASVPTLSGILQATGGTIGIMSGVLVTNKSQMKVLANRQLSLNPPVTTTPSTEIRQGTIYISPNRLRKIKFNSTTAAVQDGGIYVLFLNSADGTGTQVTYNTRLSFVDT